MKYSKLRNRAYLILQIALRIIGFRENDNRWLFLIDRRGHLADG